MAAGGTGNGPFRHPHGIDRNARGKIFVADTGNDRVVVLKMNFLASGSDTWNTNISFLTNITGLKLPHDVAWDDNGTTFTDDDYLWIAEFGNHRILKYRFNENNTYSLVESDYYGGVWVTDAQNHKIIKVDRYLNFLDSYGSYGLGQVYGKLNNPTDFSIYFTASPLTGNNYTWVGKDATFASERWGDGSGGVCYQMGTSIKYVNAIPNSCAGTNSPLNQDQEPFRPEPTICSVTCTYQITDYSRVTIWVYNTSGQLYRTLVNNQTKTYGTHSSLWDGRDNNGAPVPIGNYYFRILAVSLYTGALSTAKNSGSFFIDGASKINVGSELLEQLIPKEFALSKNFPNPFNPSTKINFEVPKTAQVVIKIYDLLGREVKTLVNEIKTQGRYQVVWNGDNASGVPVASGLYIYRMQAGDFIATHKMLMIK